MNLVSSPSTPQRLSGGLTEEHLIGITKTFLSFRKFQGVWKFLCRNGTIVPIVDQICILLYYSIVFLPSYMLRTLKVHYSNQLSFLVRKAEFWDDPQCSRSLMYSFCVCPSPECGQDLETGWDFIPVMRLCYRAEVKGFCSCKWGRSVDFELVKGRLSWVGLTEPGMPLKEGLEARDPSY